LPSVNVCAPVLTEYCIGMTDNGVFETFPTSEPSVAEEGTIKSGAALLLATLGHVEAVQILVSDLLQLIVSYSCWRADKLSVGTRLDAIDTDGKTCVATILDVKDDVETCDTATTTTTTTVLRRQRGEQKKEMVSEMFDTVSTEVEVLRVRFYLVHCVGYSSVRWDEWISSKSGRLTTLRTLTWDDCSHGQEMEVRILGTLCDAHVMQGIVRASSTPNVVLLASNENDRRHRLTRATFATTPHTLLTRCRNSGCTIQLVGALSWKRKWSDDTGGFQLYHSLVPIPVPAPAPKK
jgi:hypothetical protein